VKKLNNIQSKYPNLFEKTTSISCGDGWYWLIDNLCEQISSHIEHLNYPMKRFGVVEEPENKKSVTITYIKEKFGVLDVFCNGADDTIWHYISFACHLSTKICEECGSTKYMGRTSGWIKHLCMDCGEKNRNPWTPNDDVMKEIRKDKLIKIQESENNN